MNFQIFPLSLTCFLLSSGTEFGLYYKEENTKVEIKSNVIGDDFTNDTAKILIDDKVYDSGKTP